MKKKILEKNIEQDNIVHNKEAGSKLRTCLRCVSCLGTDISVGYKGIAGSAPHYLQNVTVTLLITYTVWEGSFNQHCFPCSRTRKIKRIRLRNINIINMSIVLSLFSNFH